MVDAWFIIWTIWINGRSIAVLPGNIKTGQLSVVLAIGAALLLNAATFWAKPILTYNGSDSAPRGFQWIISAKSQVGDYVQVELSLKWRVFMEKRGILLADVPLLKRIVATAGDQVCRVGEVISINGEYKARTLLRDEKGRALPVWQGCQTLSAGEVFLLSGKASSFDGRYFGFIERSRIIGVVRPIWVQVR